MYNQDNCITIEKLSANMPGAILVYKANESEEIIFASEELAKIFECDSPQDFMRFTGGSFSTVVYPEDIEEAEQIINAQINASGGLDYVTYRIITKNGNVKKIEDWGRFVQDDELGGLFYVYLHDTSTRDKLVALSGQAQMPEPKAATVDELTGLYNLKYLRQEGPNMIRNMFNHT